MTTDSAAAWLPHSVRRRPGWRWLRAEYLVESGRRLDRRIDDEWVAAARDALLGRGGRRSKAAVVRAAHRIWTGDPLTRALVEARLLTDEPSTAIAARFGLPDVVVAAFERVFFAVRGVRERRATDWVARMAVGYSPFAGFTRPLPGSAWRLAGWTGGPLLLDVIHAVTTGGPLPTGLVAGPDPASRESLVRLRGEVWLAMMSTRTAEEFAHAVRLRRRLRAQESRLLGRTRPATTVEDTMERYWMATPSRIRAVDAVAGWDESIPVVRSIPGDGRWTVNDGPDVVPSVCVASDGIIRNGVNDSVVIRPAGAHRERRAG